MAAILARLSSISRILRASVAAKSASTFRCSRENLASNCSCVKAKKGAFPNCAYGADWQEPAGWRGPAEHMGV